MLDRRDSLNGRLVAAAVRRMGLIPALCGITRPRAGVHRVTCEETGSWIDYDTTGWRIRRVAEHEGQEAS